MLEVATGLEPRKAKLVARAENEWPLKRTKWTKFYLDPASMALTIRVLQRLPSRSAARWKCSQMPSSCSFSGRMWASSYGSCRPPGRTIGGRR